MATGTKLGWKPFLHRRLRLFVTMYCPQLWKLRSRLSHGAGRFTDYDNIYHCCTQKTASQWFRQVFADPVFYRYSGLAMVPYEVIGLRLARTHEQRVSFSVRWAMPWVEEGRQLDAAASEHILRRGFPPGAVATHLYVDFETYSEIPKRGAFRTFFVLRDPRDIVVSWYYSACYSHEYISVIPELRAALIGLEPQEGFRRVIDSLEAWGSFDAQRSWVRSGEKILRYEELARDELEFTRNLLDFLDVRIPDSEVRALCERHSFQRMSGGREPGAEDVRSHWRKGISGDWKTRFDDETLAYFRRVPGSLTHELGYEEDGRTAKATHPPAA
jgi:hypothetical protein